MVGFETSGERLRVTFHGEPGAATRAECDEVVAKIAAAAPPAVQLVCDLTWPGAHWSAALRALPSIRAFVFDTYFQTQTRQGSNAIDLGATLQACPNVEQVFATGSLETARTTHERLRELHLLGDPLSAAFLAPLGLSRFPALQRLVVSLASDAGPGDMDTTIAMLDKLDAPALHVVYVDSLESVAAFVDAIAPRTSTWTELHAGGSAMDEDELVDTIEKHASALRHLEVLALSLDDITDEGRERIRALVPGACEIDHGWCLPAAYEAW